eukprot:1667349-Rhodomonas_salina.1
MMMKTETTTSSLALMPKNRSQNLCGSMRCQTFVPTIFVKVQFARKKDSVPGSFSFAASGRSKVHVNGLHREREETGALLPVSFFAPFTWSQHMLRQHQKSCAGENQKRTPAFFTSATSSLTSFAAPPGTNVDVSTVPVNPARLLEQPRFRGSDHHQQCDEQQQPTPSSHCPGGCQKKAWEFPEGRGILKP